MEWPRQGLKLHLGCGTRYIPGYVHIDRIAREHVDLVQDVRTLSNFADGSADVIYASQILEYSAREEVGDVLREWRRVLAPGGLLRLSVPNFDVLTRLYLTGLPLEWFLGSMFGRIPSGPGPYDYHRTSYDAASVNTVLTENGFVGVEPWDWRETEHAGVDDFSQAYFPHMEKERGMLWNLNVQARKPAEPPRG
jgi:ubiquinone/menaquinone biosynthesis C-methylase UbiE